MTEPSNRPQESEPYCLEPPAWIADTPPDLRKRFTESAAPAPQAEQVEQTPASVEPSPYLEMPLIFCRCGTHSEHSGPPFWHVGESLLRWLASPLFAVMARFRGKPKEITRDSGPASKHMD